MNDLHYQRNHALSRAPGNASVDWREPKICDCYAFNHPHLQGVSRKCAMPDKPIGLDTVVIDDWRVE